MLGPGQPGLDYQSWHLLPLNLLSHNLVQSITHLHSQPPLFNLATAFLFHLPMHLFWARLAMLLLATALPVGAFGLLLELGMGRRLAVAVVVIFIILDPAQLLYPAWYFYALPTASLLTCAAWAGARWARTKTLLPGVVFGWLVAAVVLTSSAFQVYGFVLAAIPLVFVVRRQLRMVAIALLPPLIVVGAWYANDYIQFHTVTTSSWDGMNMSRITTALDDPADLRLLVREHVLTPLVLDSAFWPISAYGKLGEAKPTGIPALDLKQKLVTPNFDNLGYVAVSKAFLSNDLHWVEHRPRLYLIHVTEGVRIWFLPADQTPAIDGLSTWPLGGWTSFYDHAVLLQWHSDPGADLTAVRHRVAPGLADLSVSLVVEFVLALVILPVLAWRRRRSDPGKAAVVTWVWFVTLVVTVTTSLVEVGENNRFRFQLGALPIVAAVVAAAWLVEDIRGRHRGPLFSRRRGLPTRNPRGSEPVEVGAP